MTAIPLISYHDVVHKPLQPIDWLVEGLFSAGCRSLVFGEVASMKSWLMLHLGLHLAAGQAWLNFQVSRPRSVLYIDEEMDERTMRRRVKRLAAGAGLPTTDLPFRIISQTGRRYGQEQQVQALLDNILAQGFDPEVVIVETLRRVLHGSENEAKDVGGFWAAVAPLIRVNKALIITHHMRKPSNNPHANNESRYRPSGSTDILAGADCAFAITKTSKNSATLECVKSRETEEPPSFQVEMAGDHEEPVTLTLVGTPSLGATVDVLDGILRHMGDKPSLETAQVLQAMKDLGSRATLYRALETLKDTGYITQVVHGVYKMTQQGLVYYQTKLLKGIQTDTKESRVLHK